MHDQNVHISLDCFCYEHQVLPVKSGPRGPLFPKTPPPSQQKEVQNQWAGIHLSLSLHVGMIHGGFSVPLLHLIFYNFTFCPEMGEMLTCRPNVELKIVNNVIKGILRCVCLQSVFTSATYALLLFLQRWNFMLIKEALTTAHVRTLHPQTAHAVCLPRRRWVNL